MHFNLPHVICGQLPPLDLAEALWILLYDPGGETAVANAQSREPGGGKQAKGGPILSGRSRHDGVDLPSVS